MRRGFRGAAIQVARCRVVERVVDQRRLARARHAGDAHEQADRQRRRVTFLRLLPRAPVDVELRLGSGLCRRPGTSMRRRPVRYWPVSDSAALRDVVGRALRDDAAAVHAGAGAHVDDVVGGSIASWSCSTTITVLPMSRRRFSVSSSRALSRWCRPIDGSSSTYMTPVRPEPIWLASRMRCASPPESVSAERSSDR